MIRFKKDDGTSYPDWQEEILNELYPNIRNGFVGTVTEHFSDKENGIRYIEGTNIHDGIISDNVEVYVTKEFHQKHKKNELKADDILMVQSGHVGDCAVVGDKYKGSNCHALIIMSNGGNCNSKFMCEYFHSYSGRKKLSVLITGNTVKHILSSDMNDFKCKVPCLEEQQKIADFLTNIDDVITASEQEIENLEEQKKGAMQKIFSQEVRFKSDDGSDFPCWKEKLIGDITQLYTGKAFSNELSDNGQFIVMDMGTVSSDGFRIESKHTDSERDLLQKDDLVMPKDDIGGGLIICKTVHIPEDNKYVLGDHVYRLRFSGYSGLFMHYLINSEGVNRSLKRKVTGSAQLGIKANNVLNQPLLIPCLEEQQKIAQLLSNYDSAIEYAKQELECWQTIKKGLLQQLFA